MNIHLTKKKNENIKVYKYIKYTLSSYTGWRVLYIPISVGNPVRMHVRIRGILTSVQSWKTGNYYTMERLPMETWIEKVEAFIQAASVTKVQRTLRENNARSPCTCCREKLSYLKERVFARRLKWLKNLRLPSAVKYALFHRICSDASWKPSRSPHGASEQKKGDIPMKLLSWFPAACIVHIHCIKCLCV